MYNRRWWVFKVIFLKWLKTFKGQKQNGQPEVTRVSIQKNRRGNTNNNTMLLRNNSNLGICYVPVTTSTVITISIQLYVLEISEFDELRTSRGCPDARATVDNHVFDVLGRQRRRVLRLELGVRQLEGFYDLTNCNTLQILFAFACQAFIYAFQEKC